MRKLVLILLIFIGLTFYRLPDTFFQQDEWATLGLMAIFEQAPFQAISILLPRSLLDHFVPMTFLIDYGQYRLFGLQFSYYAFFSLALHLINSILVYYFFWFLSQKKGLSLAASLIFALNSLSHQAVTWVSTSTSTQAATLFALISLILLHRSRLFLSLLSFFLALTFKENIASLFLFFPVFWFLFTPKRQFSQFKKLVLSLLSIFLFYLLLRLVVIISLPPSASFPVQEATSPSLSHYLYRIAMTPLRVIPQSILTTNLILRWSRRLIFLGYPQFVASDGVPNPYLADSLGFDFVCLILAAVILLGSFFIWQSFSSPLLLFALSFIIVNALPFIFIPGRAGYTSIFEPRNLYFLGIGSSLFLAICIFTLSRWLKKRWVLLILVPLLFIHSKNIRADIDQLVADGQLRKSILNQIRTTYPVLPEKVIFYTESDKAYYGLADEEKILPFQSGFGQTLLIWYHNHGEEFPLCMFTNKYEWLFQIEDQGYQYCQGRGLGYFRKFNDLKEALLENDLPITSVFAFSWKDKESSFKDITPEIREKLINYPRFK